MKIQYTGMDWKKRMTEEVSVYEEAERYINSIPRFTGKNSMEDTVRFLEHLGSPAQHCRIIHVAGTNGKGSVCAYLCSVFREAGISAGMFISPHLVSMRERLVADGVIATEEEFLQVFTAVREKLFALPPELVQESYHPSLWQWFFLRKKAWNMWCWRPALGAGWMPPIPYSEKTCA